MKLFLGLCFGFLTSTAWAATSGYELKMNLTINGKKVASPSVLVREGRATSVTQTTDGKETFIDVITSESSEKNREGILMHFTVGTIDKDGNRVILARPSLLTKENKTATITTGNLDGSEMVSLGVTAKRKLF